MSSDRDVTRIVRSWLDEGVAVLPEHVLDAVLDQVPATPQRRATSWPVRRPVRIGMNRFVIIAAGAAAAIVAAVVIGSSLVSQGGSRLGGAPTSPAASSSPTVPPVPDSTPPPYADLGLIGLPPVGATPSTPEHGELVDSYVVHGGQAPPYEGMARLYADGRLIWNEYFGVQNGSTTGHLEQRLSAEGVELIRANDNLVEKDPSRLADWLPPSAWEDQTIRAYIPRGYAACVLSSSALEYSEALALLPRAAAELLRDKETIPSDDSYGEDSRCLALTTDEARQLDTLLSEAGWEQDPFTNWFLLEYHIGGTDAGDPDLGIWFEPIFPDGTIGCSACG